MEINVWQSFVQVAISVWSLFASSTEAQRQANPISSSNAQESAASSSLTSNPTQENGLLRIIRNPAMTTKDAHFGAMVFNGENIGYTMERIAVEIPEGTYPARKEISPHFGFATPHLAVPNRTYIEIHPANYPSQLEGCVAVGTTIDNDSLDNSRAAFDKMMAIVPDEFTVEVSSL
jgi:uncharacterized protein DUF5675